MRAAAPAGVALFLLHTHVEYQGNNATFINNPSGEGERVRAAATAGVARFLSHTDAECQGNKATFISNPTGEGADSYPVAVYCKQLRNVEQVSVFVAVVHCILLLVCPEPEARAEASRFS